VLLTQLPGAAASHVRQVAVPFSYVPHATATRSAGARAPSLAPAGRPVEVAFTLSCANGGSSRLEPQMQGGCISRCGSGSGIGPERRGGGAGGPRHTRVRKAGERAVSSRGALRGRIVLTLETARHRQVPQERKSKSQQGRAVS